MSSEEEEEEDKAEEEDGDMTLWPICDQTLTLKKLFWGRLR